MIFPQKILLPDNMSYWFTHIISIDIPNSTFVVFIQFLCALLSCLLLILSAASHHGCMHQLQNVQMQEPYFKFSCKRKPLNVAPFKMLSFSSHTLLLALIQLFSPFLEYKVWPVAIKSLPLHSSASSHFMDGVEMACRNTSVWSTSFQYPRGKPSLMNGQASPCTFLFTTVPAGADVCVCSHVRP